MTMFFFFGLNGVMDILHHYRIPLPPDLEYASGILALGMEALLFFYHLHGRPPMDIQGTWFYGVAFILYSPVGEKWDVNSHQQMMIVTLIFTWHNAAIFVFLLVSGILIYFRVKSMDRSTMHKSLLSPLSQFYDHHDITKSLDYEQAKNIMMESEEEEV
ncbi:Transmembrane protein 45B [Armadillidium nasatum]|uniref:Transmembrane protein 45B n=1 Tax=Armadillidium nasatum TaxID=96803 RepID=A0A5N5SZ01_9CRUS|nr:Transmembrane protein 45B [Armadillidium nasatum]